ncbi:hypothetical protein U1Q18_003369, partial [Sarracenia purpurea var. burkii]
IWDEEKTDLEPVSSKEKVIKDALGEVEVPSEEKSKGAPTTKGNTEMTNDVENVAKEMYGTSGGEVSDSGGDTGEGVEIDEKGEVAGNVETASQLLGIDQGREKESSLNCDHNVFDKKPEPSPIAKFVAAAGQVKPGQEPDGNISKEASLLVQSGSEDEEDVDGDEEEEDGLRDKTVSGSDSGYEATGALSLTNLNQVFLSVSNVVSLPNEAHGVNLLAESCLLEVSANEESRTGAQCRDASEWVGRTEM